MELEDSKFYLFFFFKAQQTRKVHSCQTQGSGLVAIFSELTISAPSMKEHDRDSSSIFF